MLKILSFLLAIFLLVLVHEFCHFWVAKRLGVKILRFSIGLGRPLFKWRGKDKIEYVISILPLGGYVKMLDSADLTVTAKNKNLAFDKQPILTRLAIVLAGIVGNILFAIFAFWLTFTLGMQVLKPVIGGVEKFSPAYYAKLEKGDEIIKVGNENTAHWGDVLLAMLPHIGEDANVDVTIKRGNRIITNPESLDVGAWRTDVYQTEPLKDLGITPFHPIAPAIIGSLAKKSPAEKFGLQKGDQILAVDQQKIKNWDELIDLLENKPKASIKLEIKRGNQIIHTEAVIGQKYGAGWKKIGFLGITSLKMQWPKDMLREIRYAPLSALYHAPQQTLKFVGFNITLFSKLVAGKISLHILGGPIMILQTAAQALQQGIVVYLRFLAILSVTLAFTNLLPIPGLDGGYLLFLIYEVISRKPLSQRSQLLFYRLGIIFLLLILMRATINDLMRLF